MVDKIGRKMVQLVAFVGSAVFLTALFICTRRWVDFSYVLLWVSLLAMNQGEQRGIFKIKNATDFFYFYMMRGEHVRVVKMIKKRKQFMTWLQ